MTQGWLVFSTEWFRESLAKLPATPEVQRILFAIVRRLEQAAMNFPCLGETKIRLLKTRSYQIGDRSFPALRVFYFIDTVGVLLLFAEEYDEMDAASDEERLARLNLGH
ncbi:MAG: hypothetical protein AABO58_15735 [Acidobacteriota bacterium]